MKILPLDEFPEGNQIALSEMKCVYMQVCDLNSDDLQELTISTDSSGVGHYYVLETKRWAITDIDELISVLKDFKRRCR
jgi:hypothetical protein